MTDQKVEIGRTYQVGKDGDLRPVRIDGQQSGGYFFGVTAEEMNENTVTKTAPIM